MLATWYSSLRTPKKNTTTKTHTSNHLPIIIHLSHHFSDSCGTPMAPSRNTWLKRIIASLSPLSADNFHHFTASRNLADWRKSSPKNLPRSPGFSMMGVFVFFVGGAACVWKVKLDVMAPVVLRPRFAEVYTGYPFLFRYYSCMTCLWLTSPSS